MLRGRDRERGTLAEIVDRARGGHGSALLLRGEPGVGKSALLEDAVAAADGLTVLRTRGVESEAPLPFAALHRLLRPVLARLDSLPAPQADALRGAFGESAGGVGDRYLVFLATLNLLSEAAGEHPVLAVVDDAHWLDDASAAALLFTARRLEGEAVALLFAIRDDETGAFDTGDLPVLTVAGVDADAAEALIADQVGDRLEATVAPAVRAELLEVTAGNPLGLLELTRALSVEQLSGAARLPDRLPLTEGVERTFLDRYRRLPAPARTLLLVAAADDSGRASTVARAARALGADADALEVAEESGLVAEAGGTLTLRHPLVRSAIYAAATGTRRRQAHRALADALAGTPQEDRRAWHLAASVDGPDEDVVTALDDTAERARRRGGHEAAAAAWARAAELTLDPQARAHRLFAAAASTLAAGRPVETEQLVRAALVDADRPAAACRAAAAAGPGRVEHPFPRRRLPHRVPGRRDRGAARPRPRPDPRDARRSPRLLRRPLRRRPGPATIVAPPAADASAEERVAALAARRLLRGASTATGPRPPTAFRRAWEHPDRARRATRCCTTTSPSPPCTWATTSAPSSCTTFSSSTPATPAPST